MGVKELKNVVIFLQTILSFVLSGKTIMQNYCGNSKPTSKIYFESFFETTLDWKEIYLIP